MREKTRLDRCIKRLMDLTLSLSAFALLLPLFMLIALLIKLDSEGPILFVQKRVGIGKTYFNIFKFRTMRTDTPAELAAHLLYNPEQYITKVGRVLRNYSLDELPQLINIIKGDMSILGPRPALWNQFDLIEEREKYGANDIKPGLSGWAQINGRDALDIPAKAYLDGEYAKHMSIIFDIKCIFGTLSSVMVNSGVSSDAKEYRLNSMAQTEATAIGEEVAKKR